MGEATYYMKAYFKDEATAKKQEKPIEAFINQLASAEQHWQSNRDKKPIEFWPIFKKKFPLAYDYLGSPKANYDCNNGLAGRLSFASTDGEASFHRSENCLMYSAHVWHFAQWETFCDYLCRKFEALKAPYVSDEYLDPFETL